jgi:glycosyltransferase involved in cell wall biosynthesis
MSSVDVIVPCYRYAHFLCECVQSVLSQPVSPLRVAIIDDASPDNTAEVATMLAREDRRVTSLRHRANRGHIATYNEGLEWASADYVLLLSADDYLAPGALRRSTDFMDAHPKVGFAFGSALELYEDNTTRSVRPPISIPTTTRTRVLAGSEFVDISRSRNIVPTPSAVVRTSLQHRVGGYRPELPHAGDMEMWLRLASHASVGVLAACQAVYRRHRRNMSLAYTGRNALFDLMQRHAAIQCFDPAGSGTSKLSDAQYRSMLRWLAGDAIGFASTAFNQGAFDACNELSRFAVCVSPGITRTIGWTKLACKRRLGLERWRALAGMLGRRIEP